MNFIINPGSGRVPDKGEGWTNTHETARKNVYEWFYKPMLEEGIIDVEVEDTKQDDGEGRWLFKFKHKVTGKVVECHCHGIDNMEAFTKEFIFGSRVYWNGSSSGNPSLEDFKVDGFKPVQTYRKA